MYSTAGERKALAAAAQSRYQPNPRRSAAAPAGVEAPHTPTRCCSVYSPGAGGLVGVGEGRGEAEGEETAVLAGVRAGGGLVVGACLDAAGGVVEGVDERNRSAAEVGIGECVGRGDAFGAARGEMGTGTVCAEHPYGPTGKPYLSPMAVK